MWDHGEKFVSLNLELRKLDGSFRLRVDRKLLSKTPFTPIFFEGESHHY